MTRPGKWDHLRGWIVFAEWEETEGDAKAKAGRALRFALYAISPKRAFCDVSSGETFTLPNGMIIVCRVERTAPALWS